jgi:predicted phage gp36 major capsid-like protein
MGAKEAMDRADAMRDEAKRLAARAEGEGNDLLRLMARNLRKDADRSEEPQRPRRLS